MAQVDISSELPIKQADSKAGDEKHAENEEEEEVREDFFREAQIIP